jgi:hypothetical protein
VGELGTVVATADGGKTWQVQRRGGEHAAALFVHARAAGFPLDTVAMLGGQEGYLCTGLRVSGPDPASAAPSRAAEGERLGQAFRAAGGSSAEMLWAFPTASHQVQAELEETLQAWDRLHGARSADYLLRQLVLTLRTWRPAVVITDAPTTRTPGSDALVGKAVLEAFRRASDPAAFPEQLQTLGLEVCKPLKLYTHCPDGKGASVSLDLTALSPRLGSTLREFAAGPQGMLVGGAGTVPAERNYRLLADRLPGSAAHRDLMQGVSLAPGGLARRKLPAVDEPAGAMLRAVRQRANLRALAETPAEQLTNPERLLAQIGPMLADMPDHQAAPAAFSVATNYARNGQWTLAREAFQLLADRYPTHPLALDAYRWLIQHNSSSEARRRHETGQFIEIRTIAQGRPGDMQKLPTPGSRPSGAEKSPPGKPRRDRAPESKPAGVRPETDKAGNQGKEGKEKKGKTERKPLEVPRFETRQEGGVSPLVNKFATRRWYQGALDLEARMAAFGPLFGRDPAIQFCLQSARRNLGDWEPARKWYADFAAQQPDGPWRDCALAELWLANRSGPPPKPVLTCRRAETRPYLDGKLDDDCWQHAASAPLHNAAPKARTKGDGEGARDKDRLETEYPTEVRTAWDNEYLYVAVRCGHPAGQGEKAAAVRTRDADLGAHDRVSVLLDLDRDYSTCFHFQIDARGCVVEECWGDRTWSPRWYAATHREPAAWTVEVAIPLTDLTLDGLTPGRAWAANVVRVLPGRGVQAWSLPAEAPEEAMRLEGMGLLLFTGQAQPASARR